MDQDNPGMDQTNTNKPLDMTQSNFSTEPTQQKPSVPDSQPAFNDTPAQNFQPPTIFTTESPKPTSYSLSNTGMPDDRPVPVVRVLSVRGIEYAMMSIMLWVAAASLIIILASMVMGGNGFSTLSFPLSSLLVSLPVFSLLYVRLRRAELADPSLRLEASKRRFSQTTQIVAFLTCFFNLVALVYVLISSAAGNGGTPIGKTFGVTAIILAIAGGILVYYWRDEHKLTRR